MRTIYRRPSRSRNRAKLLLYDYPANKRRLMEIEAHYLRHSTEPGLPRRPGVGDPTAQAAVGLADDEEACVLKQDVTAVDNAIKLLRHTRPPWLVRLILELARRVYFQRQCTLYGYAAQVGMSERTIRRWNKILLRLIESQML